ncbi:MAG TPA: calcium/sodium antiporter [Longimicrobiales bacterium]|nr:calcium/sodium antiporter [Longimicrobiales bacterium]
MIQLVGGFIYLLMGADLLVRGAVALARRARVPPLVVALTVVALGTSLPELVVAVQAALAGHPGIVLGNVVGSNVANVLVVAGAAAALHPLAPGGRSVGRDALVMILSSLLFIGLGAFGGVDRLDGAFLLLGLAGALTLIVRDALRERKVIAVPIEWTLGLPHRGGLIALFLVAGALGLPVGARLAVEAAVDIALGLGLTETVVGLTIIAFSTSLPELATAVVAARRHDTDLVLGTVVGSNTLNLLAIMGVSALLSPARIPFPREVVVVDLPLMLGAALVIALFVWRGRTVGRIAGTLLVLGYVGYAVALFVRG